MFVDVETQDGEIITIDANTAAKFGEVQILLAACIEDGETVDHVESRNLTSPQIEALIEALQKAKEALD